MFKKLKRKRLLKPLGTEIMDFYIRKTKEHTERLKNSPPPVECVPEPISFQVHEILRKAQNNGL